MKNTRFIWLALPAMLVGVPLFAQGCAGELTTAEKEELTNGGSTGTGGSTGMAGSTGMSGGAPAPGAAGLAVLAKSCATMSICHIKDGQVPDLSAGGLSDKGVSLIGKMAAGCDTKPYVDAANPEASVIYVKVAGNTCPTRMPFGGSALSTADQQAILDWIKSIPGVGM